MRQDVTKINVWARPASAMEEGTTLELLALQPGVEEEEGATLPAGTLVHIDGDTLVAVVEDGQAIAAAASDETAPQLTELDLSSLLSVEEPEEDVLQKALLQANTVVREEATPEQPQSQPEAQPEAEDQQPQQQQQTVVIDVSSPIELCQNALIVVNGQRCVLQQDSSTGQVLAYPIREPKRKRGRPRKVVPPPTEEAPPAVEEASVTEPAAVEEDEEEDDGDKGMVEIVTEDGALVRRSRRRRKVVRTMKDFHLSEGSESEQESELDPEPRRRGRPPKNYHEEDPFWKRSNGRRRPRLRKREGTARSNPMQAFLVQMADGQTLMMQIPAASIPAGMDLHQVAQNIATSLNAAAAQQAMSGGVLTAEGAAGSPVLVALQNAISDEAQPQPPPPQPQPPAPAKRRPGRPRKRPLTPPPLPPPPPPPQAETTGESLETPVTASPTDALSDPPTNAPTDAPAGVPIEATKDCQAGGPTEGLTNAPNNVSEESLAGESTVGITKGQLTPADDGSSDGAATRSMAAVIAQSLEDAVAQVLGGPAAGPLLGGHELASVQPVEESILPNISDDATVIPLHEKLVAIHPNTDDATVIPVSEKLVTLLLPKSGGSAEEQQQLQCPACEFQAGYAQHLQEHLLGSHADAVVRCRRCPYVCMSRDALVTHYRTQHPRCICPYCDHIAEQAYIIRRHMARHTEPVACTCPVCNKRYKDPYILKMHLKMVHMPAEVLFECCLCGKKFNRKAHLKRHARTHDPNKPLKCPHCDYRGCERSDITKHMLIHEEPKHVCSICNRSFRHIKNKELHLKRHKGQKDYKCGVCDFYGYTFTDIRKHIERRHADPHTILCDRCGQAFKSQALLKEHQMSAQCEVYLIEQELTEYEETAQECLLGGAEESEPTDETLEETYVEEAEAQVLELPGNQYAVVTAAGDETEAIAEVPDAAHENHIAEVQDASHLLV